MKNSKKKENLDYDYNNLDRFKCSRITISLTLASIPDVVVISYKQTNREREINRGDRHRHRRGHDIVSVNKRFVYTYRDRGTKAIELSRAR